MINIIKGNLIKLLGDPSVVAVAHGCNCFNKMGAGFALQLARVVPEVMGIDLSTAPGDTKKLGTYSKCLVNGRWYYNLYTQFYYGRNNSHFDLMSFRVAFKSAILDLMSHGCYSIHIPRIGSGLAQGDWEVILESIFQIDQSIGTDKFIINIVEL